MPEKPPKKPAAQRADLGAPIDAWFEKQPAALHPTLAALRTLLHAELPDAETGLKWGMPFFTLGGAMVCGIRGAKAHVGLILTGPSEIFDDPEGKLSGEGATGRQLKLVAGEPLPEAEIRKWVRAAATNARSTG